MAHFTHSGNVRKLEQAQGITREDAFLLAVITPLEIYDGLKPFLNNVIQKSKTIIGTKTKRKKLVYPEPDRQEGIPSHHLRHIARDIHLLNN